MYSTELTILPVCRSHSGSLLKPDGRWPHDCGPGSCLLCPSAPSPVRAGAHSLDISDSHGYSCFRQTQTENLEARPGQTGFQGHRSYLQAAPPTPNPVACWMWGRTRFQRRRNLHTHRSRVTLWPAPPAPDGAVNLGRSWPLQPIPK